mgnify:CR=1 FL=1
MDNLDITYAGNERNYKLYIPDTPRKQATTQQEYTALIMVLHGYSGDSDTVQNGLSMNSIADTNNCIVCYPNGTRDFDDDRFWNVDYQFHRNESNLNYTNYPNDVSFLEFLAKEIVNEYNISLNNIFATGFSNGADILYNLACSDSNVFSAFAPVAGTMFGINNGNIFGNLCVDTDNNATDIDGDPCSKYSNNSDLYNYDDCGSGCAWCGNYDTTDFSSNVMCCVCNGGSRPMMDIVSLQEPLTWPKTNSIRNINIFKIHGQTDITTFINGDENDAFWGPYPSTANIMEYWKHNNNCSEDAEEINGEERYNCQGGSMWLYIHNGGHDVPGVPGDISARIWEFFSDILYESQILNLPTGWSLFSTYITYDMNMENLMESIKGKVVIVKNNAGLSYLVEWDYDDIGELVVGQGYLIKTTESTSLQIYGVVAKPEENPITLTAGWNMIGYLRKEPADTIKVFADINVDGNLIIVKDFTGNSYLPDWDYNGIGDMKPGQGYQLKITNSVVLQY